MQFIGGKRRPGSGDEHLTVTNPATGELIETYPVGSAADVDEAVAAAAAAAGDWGRASPATRSAALMRLFDVLSEQAASLASIETAQTGKPIRLSKEFDVAGTLDNVAFFAGAARGLEGRAAAEYSGEHTSLIRREPYGVIGSITPWNYPLQMAAWKILPAIAAGNTVVIKPAEITPLTTIVFAEACAQAGIPDGVVNVVTGPGAVTGEALVQHPKVAMVSFTGSTAVGRRIMRLASETGKRVHLELGGKAPFVVFADADLEAASRGAAAGALLNSGQDCTAATRAYVHASLLDEFVDGVAAFMAGARLGDPTSPDTDLGPLISPAQQRRVDGYVQRARHRSATVVFGGGKPKVGWDGTDLRRGCFYEPTLITGVHQGDEIVQEEVFGPVLVVLPFDSDDEAIRLANDSGFGLAASAWTRDLRRAMRASRDLAAGCVWINDHISIVSEMPHGGVKGSGFGKDLSTYSLEEYTTVKHVMIDITGATRREWHRTVLGDGGASRP